MQNKKTLYLHIGMPKTGTSALQSFFQLNSNQLKEQGVIYPLTGQYHDHSHHDIPFSLVKNGYKEPLSKAQQRSLLNKLNEEVKDYPRVLLSSECFPMLEGHLLFFKFLVQYEIKIICYLRRQDLFLESHYKQVIADPNLPDVNYKIDQHITKLHSIMTYLPFIESYSKLGSFIVRPYEAQSFVGGNIYRDFCDAIDIEIDNSFVFSEEESNVSESNAFVDFMRILKKYKILHTILKIISIDELRILVFENPFSGSTSSFLSRQQRTEIFDKYNSYNKKIAKLYSNKEELFRHPDIRDDEKLVYEGLQQHELFFLLSKIVNKVAVEESSLERWKYFDGMSEMNIIDLFSEVLNIKTSKETPKTRKFSLKKILARFFSSK